MNRPVDLRSGGVRWRVDAALAGGPERGLLFGPDGLRLAEWLAAGRASVVKHGPHRTVYRVALPGLDFFLKHYRLPTPRARLRRLLRPSKARQEYDRTRAAAARGVPGPEPLAFGEADPGAGPRDSYLLTRALPDTLPLGEFLEATLPKLPEPARSRLRQRVAAGLGQLLARMHAAGLTQHDLHPGNVLIRPDDDQPRLWLIDLQAVRLGRPLSWRQRLANLAVLNRYFILRAGRGDRLRFWRAYTAAAGTAPPPDAVRALERATLSSNLRFWKRLDARCRAANRYFRRVRHGPLAGHAVADLPAAALEPLLADPDAPFHDPAATLLKDSPSSTVAEIALPGPDGPVPVIFKRFLVNRRGAPWAALFRPTKALRSWVLGHGLALRRLPTPRPLAVWHRHSGVLPREGYLLTEKVADARDLAACVADLAALPAAEGRLRLRRLIDDVARLLRDLHGRRLSHRDLKAANVLVQTAAGPRPEFRLWLIDLVGVVRHRRLPRARRVRDLARLAASFLSRSALTHADRLRFLRTYRGWGVHGRAGWKCWWREIAQATEDKVLRNRRSGRPLS